MDITTKEWTILNRKTILILASMKKGKNADSKLKTGTETTQPPAASAHKPRTEAASIPCSKPPVRCRKEIVTIECGERDTDNYREFNMHKGVLCFWSDYYRCLFEGSFAEANENRLVSEERPHVFAIFESFCYTNQLTDWNDKTGIELSNLDLLRLWVFGDKYLVPALQNIVMDTLVEKSEVQNFVPGDIVRLVYEHTMPNSAPRRWCVDRHAYTNGIKKYLKEDEVDCQAERKWYTTEFLVDLLKVCCELNDKDRDRNRIPLDRYGCYYHVHNEGESCGEKKSTGVV